MEDLINIVLFLSLSLSAFCLFLLPLFISDQQRWCVGQSCPEHTGLLWRNERPFNQPFQPEPLGGNPQRKQCQQQPANPDHFSYTCYRFPALQWSPERRNDWRWRSRGRWGQENGKCTFFIFNVSAASCFNHLIIERHNDPTSDFEKVSKLHGLVKGRPRTEYPRSRPCSGVRTERTGAGHRGNYKWQRENVFIRGTANSKTQRAVQLTERWTWFKRRFKPFFLFFVLIILFFFF